MLQHVLGKVPELSQQTLVLLGVTFVPLGPDQLVRQVMQPEHVGLGMERFPVVSERRHDEFISII